MLLVIHAALAYRCNPLDEVLSHRGLALDATDARGRAALPHPLQPSWLTCREQFMPVVHRTNIGVSRIGASLPRRVGHHHFCFRANVRVALAQRDGVAITLGHLPP